MPIPYQYPVEQWSRRKLRTRTDVEMAADIQRRAQSCAVDGMTTLERNQLIKDGSNMSNDKPKSTYYSIALGSIEDERGGRYASAGSKASVIGSSPISYPQMESGPWAKNELPNEPLINGTSEGAVLGYEIDRPDTPASVVAPVGAGVDGGGSAKDTGRAATKFARRF